MNRHFASILVSAILLLVILSFTFFTVDQREQAIVLQLGEIKSLKKEPGLYLKVPMLQNVVYVDTRVRTLENICCIASIYKRSRVTPGALLYSATNCLKREASPSARALTLCL